MPAVLIKHEVSAYVSVGLTCTSLPSVLMLVDEDNVGIYALQQLTVWQCGVVMQQACALVFSSCRSS